MFLQEQYNINLKNMNIGRHSLSPSSSTLPSQIGLQRQPDLPVRRVRQRIEVSPESNTDVQRNLTGAFNAEANILENTTEILQHTRDRISEIGLNENHYIQLSNDFRDMHIRNNMSVTSVQNRLNRLFNNPNEAQQQFLQECHDILCNQHNQE